MTSTVTNPDPTAIFNDCPSNLSGDFYSSHPHPIQTYTPDQMAQPGYALPPNNSNNNSNGIEQVTTNASIAASATPKYMTTVYQSLRTFIDQRVEARRVAIARNLREVLQIAQELLREVELQEPRFINTLKPQAANGGEGGNGSRKPREGKYGVEAEMYEGLRVNSATEFEVSIIYDP